jgi:homoserine dehydrogenase
MLLGRRGALPDRLADCVRLRYVVDKRLKQVAAEAKLPPSVTLTDDLEKPLRDSEINVVVELFGGTGVAKTVIEKALRAGKDVVTANKALLAACGGDLFSIARASGRSIAFEAAVGGGIPIIAAVRNGLIGERIQSIYGIVNGTCNYILTRMSEHGMSYENALAEAQQKGYAEADPTLDVGGHDSAHKLAVLARLAFDVDVRDEDVTRAGISALQQADIEYARSMGYKVKLLATGIRRENGIELRVHPALLKREHPLSSVNGAYNAICVHGDCVGEVVFTGLGAGRWPTASAVVSDICRMALGTYQTEFARLPQFGDVPRVRLVPQDEVKMRYYFRLSCFDRPGVLAQVAGCLGRHNISIASCIQQDMARPGEDHVRVVFMTHEVCEGALRQALTEINKLDCIDGRRTCMIRVQDI